MTIYERIRQLRIQAGMSQEDLAHAMGYKDRSMITKIESGKVDISQKKILSFAKVLNTTPGYLMGWYEGNDELIKEYENRMKTTNEEDRLVHGFNSLSPRGQELLFERLEELKLLYGKKPENSSAESV